MTDENDDASDQQKRADQLWRDIGRTENAWPTAAQLVEFLRRADNDVALTVAERHQQCADAAFRCWEQDHEGQLAALSAQVRRLTDELLDRP